MEEDEQRNTESWLKEREKKEKENWKEDYQDRDFQLISKIDDLEKRVAKLEKKEKLKK